ncbi:hypothetical protein A9X01_15210 [Mycobacterium asiaticum]|uniref:Uncharacterized protein n=1 Tax=Mycobacterium asiaticum TaxID=1790 RepID=A0A1A3CNS4_MYCAS|nr:hypothetical protein A9X01_15210 [Mycobacterium asiaticum]
MKSTSDTSMTNGPAGVAVAAASVTSRCQVCSLHASISPPAWMITASPRRSVIARSVLHGSPSS